MKLKFDNPKLLADTISLLSELVLEVKAKISKTGFEITAIDPANVALISLKIPAAAFSQFEMDKEQELGLNLEDLKQALRRAPSNSSLTIERQDNMIKLKLGEKRAFNLALINVDSEEKQMPKLNFGTTIELDSMTFSEAVSDAVIVADSCSLIANENLFTMEAKGSLNSTRTELSSDEVKIKGSGSKAKYSLDYLAKFAKAMKFSPKVLISFSNDYPARFDFNNKDLELSFVLAPRIEEE
jgi:proliferating cell nuclear antigen